MAQGIHTEQTFEEAIKQGLLASGGYTKGFSEVFNPNLGLSTVSKSV